MTTLLSHVERSKPRGIGRREAATKGTPPQYPRKVKAYARRILDGDTFKLLDFLIARANTKEWQYRGRGPAWPRYTLSLDHAALVDLCRQENIQGKDLARKPAPMSRSAIARMLKELETLRFIDQTTYYRKFPIIKVRHLGSWEPAKDEDEYFERMMATTRKPPAVRSCPCGATLPKRARRGRCRRCYLAQYMRRYRASRKQFTPVQVGETVYAGPDFGLDSLSDEAEATMLSGASGLATPDSPGGEQSLGDEASSFGPMFTPVQGELLCRQDQGELEVEIAED